MRGSCTEVSARRGTLPGCHGLVLPHRLVQVPCAFDTQAQAKHGRGSPQAMGMHGQSSACTLASFQAACGRKARTSSPTPGYYWQFSEKFAQAVKDLACYMLLLSRRLPFVSFVSQICQTGVNQYFLFADHGRELSCPLLATL